MIIKKIAFGDVSESFIEDNFTSGFNIIFSDDNNKGKTIVIQSALYAIGNEPTFPVTFKYEDYYYYVEIELDDGAFLEICRKGNSFIIKKGDSISILDGTSELKRFLCKNGFYFPIIVKDNELKIVDPVLLFQIFFVGQDDKNPSTIFKAGYYKKDDFWNLLFALAGIEPMTSDSLNHEEIESKINLLKEEKKVLESKNKILTDSKKTAIKLVSQYRNKEAFENLLKRATTLQTKIVALTTRRNRAISRKLVNERTLNEINSLNKTDLSGSLYCIDCGSDRIGYKSGDKSYSFDITDLEMRRNIKESILTKIDSYKEEIQLCNLQINGLQRQLQSLLKEEDFSLESVLYYKDEIVESSDTDTKLIEIDNEIKRLSNALAIDKEKRQNDSQKREKLKEEIITTMNSFYRQIDPNGTLVFDDIFAKRNSTYSGSEGTEFYLSRLYTFAVSLKHQYPIIMDYFRDGELSTEKEERVLKGFSILKNQIIFTATLKDEELGKYERRENINAISYSGNVDSHILSSTYNQRFRDILKSMMINV